MGVKAKGGQGFKARVSELASRMGSGVVRVGFLEGATYPDGKSVAFVAAMNEYGHRIGSASEEDSRGIVPPRPFFRNMIAAKRDEWPAGVALQLKRNDGDVERTLDIVGSAIAGQLRQAISDFSGAPLAASTVARKGHDKQLVDTGHMLASVDHEVVAK
jgi:hypothetical protein